MSLPQGSPPFIQQAGSASLAYVLIALGGFPTQYLTQLSLMSFSVALFDYCPVSMARKHAVYQGIPGA